MQFKKKDIIEIIENAFTYIVVFAMFAYGIGKTVQFNNTVPINKTIAQMTSQQIMWAFYGYSKPFVITLGVLEVSSGILMLIRKTRILGCLFVTTILVNVILQDIFYEVNVGALRAAIIYQSLILFILWLNKDKLIQCFKILLNTTLFDGFEKKYFVKTILSLILFIILRVLEFYVTIKL
jgi:hypothetical protein